MIAADGEDYIELARNRLGNDCYASPAIAAGSMFYRVGVGSGQGRQEKLVCLRSESSSETVQSPN